MLFTNSFSRTCPVIVSYPKSGRSIEGPAIIDDQCTHSLVNSELPKELHITKEDLSAEILITSTVNGIARNKTETIKNLLITPLNGDAQIRIANACTSHIPDVLSTVPTPQEVLSIPGISHLAKKFPIKKEWPTLILIGRDCTQAQKHLQYVTSEDGHQLVIQTPLGWTIMGKPAESTRPLVDTPNVTLQTLTRHITDQPSIHPSSEEPSTKHLAQVAKHYASESDQLANAIQGSKEDELPGYSQDEIAFLNDVLRKVKQRPNNMIELPFPFTEAKPTFSYNRTVAFERTKNTLNTMRKKEPEFFQKSLEKFSKNIDIPHPRFEPVPYAHRHNKDGHAYWIPIFCVKQKGKSRIVFDSAAKNKKSSASTTNFAKAQTETTPFAVLITDLGYMHTPLLPM